jgi:hypothetical protein
MDIDRLLILLTIKMWSDQMQHSQILHVIHTIQVSSANVLLSIVQIKCLIPTTTTTTTTTQRFL